MIDRLILIGYIEIVGVIVFVLFTVPIWQKMENKIDEVNASLLEEYNYNFNISVNNYFLSKNYKLLRDTNKLLLLLKIN